MRFVACPTSVSSSMGNNNLSNVTNLPRRIRFRRYFAGVAEQEMNIRESLETTRPPSPVVMPTSIPQAARGVR